MNFSKKPEFFCFIEQRQENDGQDLLDYLEKSGTQKELPGIFAERLAALLKIY